MDKVQVISAQDKVEKISKIVLWSLIDITLVVIEILIQVGYNTPYEENIKQVNPQMTDLLLIWTYILIFATIIITVGAVIYGFVNGSNKSKHEDKGMASKAGLIAWGTLIIGVVAGLIVGFANKDEVLLINGKDWNIPSDIILTDTSMIAILVLTIVTIIVSSYSMITNKK